jgi:hypothetical protein
MICLLHLNLIPLNSLRLDKTIMSQLISMEIELKIQLGDCGMGMPVIRTWQAMKKLAKGDVLQVSSSHP